MFSERALDANLTIDLPQRVIAWRRCMRTLLSGVLAAAMAFAATVGGTASTRAQPPAMAAPGTAVVRVQADGDFRVNGEVRRDWRRDRRDWREDRRSERREWRRDRREDWRNWREDRRADRREWRRDRRDDWQDWADDWEEADRRDWRDDRRDWRDDRRADRREWRRDHPGYFRDYREYRGYRDGRSSRRSTGSW